MQLTHSIYYQFPSKVIKKRDLNVVILVLERLFLNLKGCVCCFISSSEIRGIKNLNVPHTPTRMLRHSCIETQQKMRHYYPQNLLNFQQTRMHSSRMRNARLLTVPRIVLTWLGVHLPNWKEGRGRATLPGRLSCLDAPPPPM